jgi:hypothetical protein
MVPTDKRTDFEAPKEQRITHQGLLRGMWSPACKLAMSAMCARFRPTADGILHFLAKLDADLKVGGLQI